jgi:hypothetical protein
MTEIVVREGMFCGNMKQVATLAFVPQTLKPYLFTVVCSTCALTYETTGLPEEFSTYQEMRDESPELFR